MPCESWPARLAPISAETTMSVFSRDAPALASCEGGAASGCDAGAGAARATGRMGPLFAIPNRILEAVITVAEPIGHLFGSDLVSRASLGAVQSAPAIDITKARDELGYAPRPSETTVADLVDFFAEVGRLGSARPKPRATPTAAVTAVG